jgi:single-stranded-DNA-specific exonuclease
LAPRLNAAGRLASPRVALDLLLSDDPAECQQLAQRLEELNRERQAKTKWATDEASALVDGEADLERDCLIVAAREGWHKGVVGLIASKLVEKYHRPAFAMNIHDGVAHGSGRSTLGFDLHELVEATRDYLLSGGGHAAACGLSLEAGKLPRFREAAQEFAASKLEIDQLVPRVEADVEVNGTHVTPQLSTDLQKLEPCGTGNEAATLMLRRAKLLEVRPIGQTGEHFKWRLLADGRTHEAVWWRSAERMKEFAGNQLVDLVFVPELNSYNGRTNVQLVVKDARPL